MSNKAELYVVIDNFEPGDPMYIHNLGISKPALGHIRSHGSMSRTKLGTAVEPIFAEGGGSSRSLTVMGPEIRLHDDKTGRYGAVVGFVSSFKGDPRLKKKAKSAFRRRLDRLFESDGPVVVVFMAVLLVLGISIGAIATLLISH